MSLHTDPIQDHPHHLDASFLRTDMLLNVPIQR